MPDTAGGTPALPNFRARLHKTAAAAIGTLVLTAALASGAGKNLLPNGGFEGKDPLHGWLTDFPDEAFYKGNAPYVKMAPPGEVGGRKAVMLDLPAGIAGNQGGKIESVPVPVEAGATYHIEVDCMTWDFSAKIHAEAWSTDPHPDQKRTIFRRAPADGRPALIMCYPRAGAIAAGQLEDLDHRRTRLHRAENRGGRRQGSETGVHLGQGGQLRRDHGGRQILLRQFPAGSAWNRRMAMENPRPKP